MVYYNENDPKTAAWLRELIKAGLVADGEVDTRSIELVQPGDVRGFAQCHFFAGIGGWSYALRLAGWPDDRHVWTGSCPCQPFSAAGFGLTTTDTRHLWPTWRELIAELRPTRVFGEQVAGADGRAWFDLVCDDLETLLYAVGAVDMPACSVGPNHIRYRLWWVADADAERFIRPETWQPDSDQQRHVASPQPEGFPIVRATGASVQSPWPPGPGRVGEIPRMADGVSGWVVDGFGNAIVPQVAAEFIQAYLEATA